MERGHLILLARTYNQSIVQEAEFRLYSLPCSTSRTHWNKALQYQWSSELTKHSYYHLYSKLDCITTIWFLRTLCFMFLWKIQGRIQAMPHWWDRSYGGGRKLEAGRLWRWRDTKRENYFLDREHTEVSMGVEGNVVNLMLIDLPIFVKLVLWHPIKMATTLPWNSWNAMNSPANQDDVLHRLPHTKDFNPQSPEEYPSVESQSPEDCFVVLNASECVQGILEHNIIPVYVESGLPVEQFRELLTQTPNSIPHVDIVVLFLLRLFPVLRRSICRRRRRRRSARLHRSWELIKNPRIWWSISDSNIAIVGFGINPKFDSAISIEFGVVNGEKCRVRIREDIGESGNGHWRVWWILLFRVSLGME